MLALKSAFLEHGVQRLRHDRVRLPDDLLPAHDAVEHADSVGYAVPVVDLAVDSVGADPQVGELLARGPNVLAGYWQRPERHASAFTGGWLRTGDVVRVDDAGRVHIVDRLKDIINRGGENVSSVEVEDALATAPGVAEAAVIAVPDEVMGEKVGAVLVPVGGQEIDVDTRWSRTAASAWPTSRCPSSSPSSPAAPAQRRRQATQGPPPRVG